MSPAAIARVRVTVLLLVGLVVQTTFGADLRILHVGPDLMLLLTICAGLTAGAESGAIVGFAAGMLADLSLSSTPVGLTALSWCLVGWAVGTLRSNVLPGGRVAVPVIAFGATVAGIVLFLILGDLVGQSQLIGLGRSYLVRVAVIESLWAALLALPIAWLYEHAARGSAAVDALRRPEAVSSR